MTDDDRLSGDEVQRQVSAILADTARTVSTAGGAHPARGALDSEMREIKDNILRMGSYVEEAIRATIRALVGHDAAAATEVIAADAQINEMQREVTGLITRTIATQSPVARDLRFLLALIT
jgi:phosphate uptake regulator